MIYFAILADVLVAILFLVLRSSLDTGILAVFAMPFVLIAGAVFWCISVVKSRYGRWPKLCLMGLMIAIHLAPAIYLLMMMRMPIRWQ